MRIFIGFRYKIGYEFTSNATTSSLTMTIKYLKLSLNGLVEFFNDTECLPNFPRPREAIVRKEFNNLIVIRL